MSRTVTAYDYKQSEIVFLFDSYQNKISLLDALNKHGRIALLGSAGSGKSFELIHLGRILQSSVTSYVGNTLLSKSLRCHISISLALGCGNGL